eukprot:TRINITY_DN24888_c0_g4_i1.p1 TRINITY_DN24888_c0_g4~~TRINITY_DN24888_c0_g4_i1.p1  ORF type:complete len:730 (-),score=161.92 TRINITY_DN24888_c0_g4_i1:215-2341(-)
MATATEHLAALLTAAGVASDWPESPAWACLETHPQLARPALVDSLHSLARRHAEAWALERRTRAKKAPVGRCVVLAEAYRNELRQLGEVLVDLLCLLDAVKVGESPPKRALQFRGDALLRVASSARALSAYLEALSTRAGLQQGLEARRSGNGSGRVRRPAPASLAPPGAQAGPADGGADFFSPRCPSVAQKAQAEGNGDGLLQLQALFAALAQAHAQPIPDQTPLVSPSGSDPGELERKARRRRRRTAGGAPEKWPEEADAEDEEIAAEAAGALVGRAMDGALAAAAARAQESEPDVQVLEKQAVEAASASTASCPRGGVAESRNGAAAEKATTRVGAKAAAEAVSAEKAAAAAAAAPAWQEADESGLDPKADAVWNEVVSALASGSDTDARRALDAIVDTCLSSEEEGETPLDSAGASPCSASGVAPDLPEQGAEPSASANVAAVVSNGAKPDSGCRAAESNGASASDVHAGGERRLAWAQETSGSSEDLRTVAPSASGNAGKAVSAPTEDTSRGPPCAAEASSQAGAAEQLGGEGADERRRAWTEETSTSREDAAVADRNGESSSAAAAPPECGKLPQCSRPVGTRQQSGTWAKVQTPYTEFVKQRTAVASLASMVAAKGHSQRSMEAWECPQVDYSDPQLHKYAPEQLRTPDWSRSPLPDVDPRQRERYLRDEDFSRLFGTTREAFEALPGWRRQAKKKELGFF